MTDPPKPPERFSLSRWSRRKLESARGESAPKPAELPPPVVAPASEGAVAASAAQACDGAATPALTPIESLTIDSDYTAFLQPTVDEPVRRAALRKLFSDPHFNVMDGLDVYIDDYSKSEPISPEIMGRLAQARYVLDPPRTRVNAQGFVEDVPKGEAKAAEAAQDGLREGEASRTASSARAGDADAPAAVPDDGGERAQGDVEPVPGPPRISPSGETPLPATDRSLPADGALPQLPEQSMLERNR